MNLFLIEQLNNEALLRNNSVIRSAEQCWALQVPNAMTAKVALDDSRWQAGNVPLFASIETELGTWAQALVMDQSSSQRALSSKEQALLAYGVEVRLWSAALAKGIVKYAVGEKGSRPSDLHLKANVINPYLYDALRSLNGVLGSVSFCGALQSLMVNNVRERLVGSLRYRTAALRLKSKLGHKWRGEAARSFKRGNSKRLCFFCLNRRGQDLFQPIQTELMSRGWEVISIFYNPLVAPPGNSIAFEAALALSSGYKPDITAQPRWIFSEELLSRSPVTKRLLTLSMDSSWSTAVIQTALHQAVLEAMQPDVVISFGPEVMSLALQNAADRLSIPSLFLNHTFREPARSCWFFQATASAMAGQACVSVNKVNLLGQVREGLVATGHPPYDDMLKRSLQSTDQPPRLSELKVGESRKYVAVAFALWGMDLLYRRMQVRALRMLGKALPHDVFLIFKLHPNGEERTLCESVLREYLPEDAFKVVGDDEYCTPDLLESCHVAVVHELSMSLVDALVMNRPAVVIRHPEFPIGAGSKNHPSWTFERAWQTVGTEPELGNALVALTRDKAHRQTFLDRRKQFIETFLVASDGRATHRVVDLIAHVASGKSVVHFTPVSGESLLNEC